MGLGPNLDPSACVGRDYGPKYRPNKCQGKHLVPQIIHGPTGSVADKLSPNHAKQYNAIPVLYKSIEYDSPQIMSPIQKFHIW